MAELSETQKLQAQAHFSDYQAMVSKINWFMTLQFRLFTPLVSFVSLGVAAYTHDYRIAGVWGTTVVVQAISITYLFALYEVYNHVRYIETKLKPRLAGLITLDTDDFWGYEKMLKKDGKAHSTAIGDAIFPIAVSTIALCIAFYMRLHVAGYHIFLEWRDCLGMLVASALLYRTIHSARRTSNMRKEFEKALTTEVSPK